MVSFGFFNSSNGDRKYSADDVSRIFSYLITDGVLMTYGDKFFTTPSTSTLGVMLGTGWAWFNSTWTQSDAKIPFALSEPDPSLDRYDTICLKVDKRSLGRMNSFVLLEGAPAVTPKVVVPPTETDIYYHPLAHIKVRHGVTRIAASDIDILVGKTNAPFITSILQTTDITTLFQGWSEQFGTKMTQWEGRVTALETSGNQQLQAQQTAFDTAQTNRQNTFNTSQTNRQNTFNTSITGWETEFRTWFDNLQTYLSQDVVTAIWADLEELKAKNTQQDTEIAKKLNISSKATEDEAKAGTEDTHYMTPAKVNTQYLSKKAKTSDWFLGSAYNSQDKDIWTNPTYVNYAIPKLLGNLRVPFNKNAYANFSSTDTPTMTFTKSMAFSSADFGNVYVIGTPDAALAFSLGKKYTTSSTLLLRVLDLSTGYMVEKDMGSNLGSSPGNVTIYGFHPAYDNSSVYVYLTTTSYAGLYEVIGRPTNSNAPTITLLQYTSTAAVASAIRTALASTFCQLFYYNGRYGLFYNYSKSNGSNQISISYIDIFTTTHTIYNKTYTATSRNAYSPASFENRIFHNTLLILPGYSSIGVTVIQVISDAMSASPTSKPAKAWSSPSSIASDNPSMKLWFVGYSSSTATISANLRQVYTSSSKTVVVYMPTLGLGENTSTSINSYVTATYEKQHTLTYVSPNGMYVYIASIKTLFRGSILTSNVDQAVYLGGGANKYGAPILLSVGGFLVVVNSVANSMDGLFPSIVGSFNKNMAIVGRLKNDGTYKRVSITTIGTLSETLSTLTYV